MKESSTQIHEIKNYKLIRGTKKRKNVFSYVIFLAIMLLFWGTSNQLLAQNKITSPKEQFGINIGDDYHLINYTQISKYWEKLSAESNRMKLVDIGITAEGRKQLMAIISSPENLKKLDYYRNISSKLALAKGLDDASAKKLSLEGKAIVWIDGGLHANEVVGSHQLMKLVYNMVSKNDDETLRVLDDVILLAVFANPDGLELVANWYMRKKNEKERSSRGLPRLYHKYIGHDNNRDSYMATQPETENMARIMYKEWYPQIMYNHHQTGPSDIVVFVPPFRDPPNYNYDPLIITGIQALGTAMHSRLISDGLPGSGMRSRSNYSTWFNGNLRTTGYFHNQIGLLTEIKGNPTPMKLAFYPDRQLASMDLPFPHEPKTFHFSDAMKYSMAMDMAVLDYASRYRETVLYNRYLMGKHHIEKGSKDNWTVHPKIVEEVNQAVKNDPKMKKELNFTFRRRGSGVPDEYFKLFRKPENRDARGYILPADQDDFPTAVKFVNTFIKNGIEVLQATEDFKVNGKAYKSGSFIFKTDQAFRPHIIDLFEPQDHPNDFLYEGGPPVPPYDNAGYTLAFQMGIKFDRILEGFDGPFKKLEGMAKPLAGKLINSKNAKGYLISHQVNDASIVVNRLLKSKHQVYWLNHSVKAGNKEFPAGTIYVKAKKSTAKSLGAMANELGMEFVGVKNNLSGDALKLSIPRIGLWDRYGGSMPSGWTRWILEQYEFIFTKVFSKTLDEDNLNDKFDVLVFVTGAIPAGERRSMSYSGSTFDINSIPEKYRDWIGHVSTDKTIPKLIEFVNKGGTIIAIGSSTNIAKHLHLPMSNHLVDGFGKQLTSEQYYIPSSILQVRVNNKRPIAYGMNERVDVFFNKSPVFRFKPNADKNGLLPIAWFDSDKPLRSGWAWGQDRLFGGVAMAESSVGKGKVYLFGPEILFRAQPHGTFKLFFNGLYLSCAK